MAQKGGTQAVGPDFTSLRKLIDTRLAELVPEKRGPAEAARHSLLAPGKRLRAILTLIAAEECGGGIAEALDVACAVEMIHTASLIFDDLPAMDDAELRRGMTTPHVIYGVDVAILAGIGLLNGAFGVVAAAERLGDAAKAQITAIISSSVGWSGLVGGQALDLGSHENEASLEAIQDGKTGVLFEAAALGGAAAAGKLTQMEGPLCEYARALGRAYQALDDILDQVADDELAGKSTARDEGKLTAMSDTKSTKEALAGATAHLEAAKAALPQKEGVISPLAQFTDCILEYFEATFEKAAARKA